MSFHHPHQIIGFHSCDRKVGLSILNGNDALRSSLNLWDWLGGGIYFWEQNPGRALEYAIECADKSQKFNGDINNPFVLGSVINLGNCLNLVEAKSIPIIKAAFKGLEKLNAILNIKMPKNNGANRKLDCAVIEFLHKVNKNSGIAPYDSIRCSFAEGRPVFPTSNFLDRSHIEVCIINPEMILGYFLPCPVEKFNPYLKTDYLPLN